MYITHPLPIVGWLNYPLGVIAGVLKLKALCKLYIQSAQSNSPSSLCARARWICVRALSPMIELHIQHLNVSQAIQINNVTYWKQYYVILCHSNLLNCLQADHMSGKGELVSRACLTASSKEGIFLLTGKTLLTFLFWLVNFGQLYKPITAGWLLAQLPAINCDA